MTRASRTVFACILPWVWLAPGYGFFADSNSFKLGNDARRIGGDRWSWTVYVSASPQVLSRIRCVEYTLHPTFPDPLQVVCDRGNDDARAFAIQGSGWGEFQIKVKATFTDSRVEYATHWLNLKTQEPQVCRVMAQRNVSEDEIWSLPRPFRNVYIYVEELHRRKPAELVVFNTDGKVDTQNPDWDEVKKPLRKALAGKPLTPGTYLDFSMTPKTVVKVESAGSPQLAFYVHETNKGSVELSVCEVPGASAKSQ